MFDEVDEQYRRAADIFDGHVHAVKPEQWTAPTPCTEWDVRAIVNHLVFENLWAVELFAGKTIAEVGGRLDGDLLGDEPVKKWDDSIAAARAALEEEGALERTVHLSFGDVPGRVYGFQLFSDLLVHSWDLARGIGADDDLPDDLCAACLEGNKMWEDAIRGSGLYADEQEAPSDADIQTRLLAFVGRRA